MEESIESNKKTLIKINKELDKILDLFEKVQLVEMDADKDKYFGSQEKYQEIQDLKNFIDDFIQRIKFVEEDYQKEAENQRRYQNLFEGENKETRENAIKEYLIKRYIRNNMNF